MEKIPPQNIEAEQSVLGCLMLDKNAIVKVADILRPGDFYRDVHNLIFEAMIELYEKGEPIDLLSLTNRLEEKGVLEEIGGPAYLTIFGQSCANGRSCGALCQNRASQKCSAQT